MRKGALAGAVAQEGLILQVIASGCLQALQVLIVVYVMGVLCKSVLCIAGIELLEGCGVPAALQLECCQ